jgi:hypothetical protein
MFRPKFSKSLKITGSIFLFLALAFCSYFIYFETRHPLNIALFKFTYNILPAKKLFLETYSPRNRDVDGGYIPPEVDEFLCQRVETTNETEEIAAIANFYALQAGGREGTCIFKVSDAKREKIAAEIIRRMDDDPDLWGQMILLEQIRLGESLGKASISSKPSSELTRNIETRQDWEKWNAEHLPGGREKFRQWWNLNLSWEEKKKIDPLADAEIVVNSCC